MGQLQQHPLLFLNPDFYQLGDPRGNHFVSLSPCSFSINNNISECQRQLEGVRERKLCL